MTLQDLRRKALTHPLQPFCLPFLRNSLSLIPLFWHHVLVRLTAISNDLHAAYTHITSRYMP